MASRTATEEVSQMWGQTGLTTLPRRGGAGRDAAVSKAMAPGVTEQAAKR